MFTVDQFLHWTVEVSCVFLCDICIHSQLINIISTPKYVTEIVNLQPYVFR